MVIELDNKSLQGVHTPRIKNSHIRSNGPENPTKNYQRKTIIDTLNGILWSKAFSNTQKKQNIPLNN